MTEHDMGLGPDIEAQARQQALEIARPNLEVIEHIEAMVGVPLILPEEVRRNTPLPRGADISAEADTRIRAEAGKLGIGRGTDLTVAEAGFINPNEAQQNIEGGRVDGKVQAELTAALASGTGPLVLTLTKHRGMDQKEHTFLTDRRPRSALPAETENGTSQPDAHPSQRVFGYLGISADSPETEFEGGVVVAAEWPGFKPLARPHAIGRVGVHGEVNGEGITGRLDMIGRINGRDVYVQEVPREYLTDVDGEPILDDRGRPTYDQSDAGQLLVATSELLGTTEAAVTTSTTYYPTRVADIAKATYNGVLQGGSPKRFAVTAYCPTSLARAKAAVGEVAAVPETLSLGHLLGEVKFAEDKFRELVALASRGFSGETDGDQ